MSNEYAIHQAQNLARDYEGHALKVLGILPRISNNTTRTMLADWHLRVTPRREGPLMPNAAETIEVFCTSADVPDSATLTALGILTRNTTASLDGGCTVEGIGQRQRATLAELDARRTRLSRPLGHLGLLKSVRRERRKEWAAHLAETLDIFDVLPVASAGFDDVFDRVLRVAGLEHSPEGYTVTEPALGGVVSTLTVDELGDHRYEREALKLRATANANAMDERWETILVWVYEAATSEEGGATEEGDLEHGRRERYRTAMSAKAAHQAAQQSEAQHREEEIQLEARRQRVARRRERMQREGEARIREREQSRRYLTQATPQGATVDEGNERDGAFEL